jgi:hypothetical protein
LLFLLTDDHGRGIIIAEAASKAQANAFGFTHLPDFSGKLVEIDPANHSQAEDFWSVRTVSVVNVQLEMKSKTRTAAAIAEPAAEYTTVWVRGPKLPDEVEADGLLTPEDHRELTLDHIARTCNVVVQLQIVKLGF